MTLLYCLSCDYFGQHSKRQKKFGDFTSSKNYQFGNLCSVTVQQATYTTPMSNKLNLMLGRHIYGAFLISLLHSFSLRFCFHSSYCQPPLPPPIPWFLPPTPSPYLPYSLIWIDCGTKYAPGNLQLALCIIIIQHLQMP